jgi:hypothetical protein
MKASFLKTRFIVYPFDKSVYFYNIDPNRVLKERLKELEILLLENGIAIPDYGIWHGKLPYV